MNSPPGRMRASDDLSAEVPTTDAAALPPEVDAWLDWLASQRRAADPTLINYRRDLMRLTQLLDGELLGVDAAGIRRCVARLHAEGHQRTSIARYLSAWRSFYRWLVRARRLADNPVEGVRAPRGARRLPRALSPDQAHQLLGPTDGSADARDDTGSDAALQARDRAMFELLYSSGLRVAELVSLDVGPAIDAAQGLVTVIGKRSKPRTVPVGSVALAALADWLACRSQLARSDEPALFVSRQGGRLTTSAVRSRLTRWAAAAGMAVPVHPHMLRHSMASHVLQSSGDLRAVQEMLGHASIQSTQIYTHLDFQQLAKVYDAAHPRARRKD